MSVWDYPYSNVAVLWASAICRKSISSVPVRHWSGWEPGCWHGHPSFLPIGQPVPASMCGILLPIEVVQIHVGQAESTGRCRPREEVRPYKAGKDDTLRFVWNKYIGSHLYPSRKCPLHEPPCRGCSVHVFRWDEIRSLLRLMGEILFLPSGGCSGSHSEFAERCWPVPSGRRSCWGTAASVRALREREVCQSVIRSLFSMPLSAWRSFGLLFPSYLFFFLSFVHQSYNAGIAICKCFR